MKLFQRTQQLIYRTSLAIALAGGTVLAADQSERSPTTQGAGAAQLQQHDQQHDTKGPGADRTQDRTFENKNATASSSLKPADAKSFLKEAFEGNAAEIALAEVAERKSQNQEVKQFAAMMRQDHRQANEQLRSIAQSHGVTLTPPLDSKHQQTLSKLQQASGAEFDKAYMTEMLKDHHKDVQQYRHAAEQLKEPDVKQYAQSTLPKLEKHLQHAQKAARAVGIDQQTISSYSIESSTAVGGTSDKIESESGQGSSKEQND